MPPPHPDLYDDGDAYVQALAERGHDPASMAALYNANYGYATQMKTVPVSGGFNIQPTTLLADVHSGQNEWMVTIVPPTRSDNALQVPWMSSFDGTTTPPNSGNNFSAPVLPVLGLQCRLRWAAGGVTFYSAFDYPSNGAVFGIACETLNLDVALKPGASTVLYTSLSQVPYIGALMTEGAPANPRPLRWTDVRAAVSSFAGGNPPKYWPVRPYARRVDIYAENTPSANTQFLLIWLDADGNEVYSTGWTAVTAGVVSTGSFDVPPTAVAFSLQQTAGTADVSVMPVWEISFA